MASPGCFSWTAPANMSFAPGGWARVGVPSTIPPRAEKVTVPFSICPLSAFAYLMVHTLRWVRLAGTKLARAQSWTLRLKLLKIGAQVRVTTRKVWLSFSEGYPYAALLRTVLTRTASDPASVLATQGSEPSETGK